MCAAARNDVESAIISFAHGFNPRTVCRIHMLGATITSWKVDGEEMLYLSKKCDFDKGMIRGGVSVSFPHTGPGTFGAADGFAMTSREWKVHRPPSFDKNTGDVKVILSLQDSAASKKVWNGSFSLLYTIVLTKDSIKLKADVTNEGRLPMSTGFTFRTHISVPDVTKCSLGNMKGLFFIDKAEDGWPDAFERQALVTFNRCVDRVYAQAPPTCFLTGLKGGKQLQFVKDGFTDTACWNPWNKFKLADMQGDDYRRMVCVDASQASKKVYLKNGEAWSGSYAISVAPKNPK